MIFSSFSALTRIFIVLALVSVCVVAKCVSVTDVVWHETLFTVISKTLLYLKNNFNHDNVPCSSVSTSKFSTSSSSLSCSSSFSFKFYATANECNDQY